MNLTMIDCIFDTNSQYKCIDSDGDLIHINDIIPIPINSSPTPILIPIDWIPFLIL